MIRTRRLEIRPYRSGDYLLWKTGILGRRPKQSKFDPGPLPPRQITRKAFEKKQKRSKLHSKTDEHYRFGVFLKGGRVHVGELDILVFHREILQWANLGYSFHNQYWGRGYAKEASRALIRYAFQRLKLHRMEASTDLDNKASMAVARGIGMRDEGIRKNFLFQKTRWIDLHVFACTASDFGISIRPTRGRRRV